jgi:hypothetical protein
VLLQAPESSGIAFAQNTGKGKDKSSKNKDNSWQTKATCHHCDEIGHIRLDFPVLEDDDPQGNV